MCEDFFWRRNIQLPLTTHHVKVPFWGYVSLHCHGMFGKQFWSSQSWMSLNWDTLMCLPPTIQSNSRKLENNWPHRISYQASCNLRCTFFSSLTFLESKCFYVSVLVFKIGSFPWTGRLFARLFICFYEYPLLSERAGVASDCWSPQDHGLLLAFSSFLTKERGCFQIHGESYNLQCLHRACALQVYCTAPFSLLLLFFFTEPPQQMCSSHSHSDTRTMT